MRSSFVVGIVLGLVAALPHARAETEHDFIAEAKALLVVGACAEGELPAQIDPAVVARHCRQVRELQADYKASWLGRAKEFFAAHVPATIPKVVVYPFAGGDLSTALAVYPDADEITTLSLEPAGDPRALGRVGAKELRRSLATVSTELRHLYRSNFSVTMNMIGAMRTGALPTQLIFVLSALTIHGYEPVSLHYFQLTTDGALHYLTTADLERIDTIKSVKKRNRELANIELRFHKQGSTREQIYRHIMANLDDQHLAGDPSALRYLESKGKVSAMTKAASYLLSFDAFSKMRRYLVDHVEWMVSDSTGLPPKYGKPAGFEYETHGEYVSSNMKAGREVTPEWQTMFAQQPKRPLAFRFGYPDGKFHGHLIIMRKPAAPN